MPAVTDPSSIGDELEQWLMNQDDEDKKKDDGEGGE
jgi:hypothetical protein